MSHQCHATGCRTAVAPQMWGCRRHWFMVPRGVRERIWLHYRRGQEDDKRPSREYLEAAREAVVAVARAEGVSPDVRLYDAFLTLEGRCPCCRCVGDDHESGCPLS